MVPYREELFINLMEESPDYQLKMRKKYRDGQLSGNQQKMVEEYILDYNDIVNSQTNKMPEKIRAGQTNE